MNVEKIQQLFYGSQFLLGAVFLGLAWLLFRPRTPESGFRVRESELAGKSKKSSPTDLADARLRTRNPETVLQLEGIRLDGPAHEILGVRADASAQEIQAAFRERMKRFHPDKVGPPGSREWQDAQKIAQSMIQAKNELLKNRRS